MIKVFLAEDHNMVRMGISLMLSSEHDIEVIGEADRVETAVTEVGRLRPDVVVIDLSFPSGLSGFSAIEQMRASMPELRFVILTMYDGEAYVRQAIKIGVEGYVLKNGNSEDLKKAILCAHQGIRYYQTPVKESLIEEWLQINSSQSVQKLTDREIEIVKCSVAGYSNKNIAEMLHISVKTVENHKSKIMAKLNIHTRQELISYAMMNQLANFHI